MLSTDAAGQSSVVTHCTLHSLERAAWHAEKERKGQKTQQNPVLEVSSRLDLSHYMYDEVVKSKVIDSNRPCLR